MSVEQHIPMSDSTEGWLNSLERAIEICRDQIEFARAMNIGSVAVPVDSLEKILNTIAELEKERYEVRKQAEVARGHANQFERKYDEAKSQLEAVEKQHEFDFAVVVDERIETWRFQLVNAIRVRNKQAGWMDMSALSELIALINHFEKVEKASDE